ncbi:hypothetical protein EUTSA_v10009823mg [Eutrema salsugineum]|uniref:F-box associated beta-propeller type 3 domain-containing protein n=1 Tax=Eutrema salsugineum TaxID=72664 RepID=V4KQI3_EUTSA|nr:hypothetical protein EUTSA_v10009823mg [Eutrema salsugineum]
MYLIPKILWRLPEKSIGRFHCVSKLWGSMLHRPYSTELFLTRSSTRPRLLFALEGADDEWNFYSSPQPQNPDGKSSLVVAADFHTKICGYKDLGDGCSYTSGLIYYPDMIFRDNVNNLVCNPITGKSATLPKVLIYRKSTSFLGFDPINKQFKVLSEAYTFCPERVHHKILTLGTGKLKWRGTNHCPWYNSCWSGGICIDGVLYYLGSANQLADWFCKSSDEFPSHVKIVCFDVRSEKFKLIDTKCYWGRDYDDRHATKLVNYKGKLGGIILEHDGADDAIKLRMWVLEDVEKQEFSNYVYTFPENKLVDWDHVSVAGVTAKGEIVLSMKDASKSKPFYVFYFNPERNTLQSVEIQGFGENLSRVKVFIDHEENLNFIKEESVVPKKKKKIKKRKRV